jgi:hypothetical protein
MIRLRNRRDAFVAKAHVLERLKDENLKSRTETLITLTVMKFSLRTMRSASRYVN